MRTRCFLITLLAGMALCASPVLAQAPTNDDCLACHSDASLTGSGGRSVTVPPEAWARSIHAQSGIACVNCHTQLQATEFPHAEHVAPVRCGLCHEQPVARYEQSVHAEARRATVGSVAATCTDCHGVHDILASSNPDSRTYHLNLPTTCGRCHGNPEIIKRGHIAIGNVLQRFQDSIHGQALLQSGLLVAPNCSDCHGAHDIQRDTNPDSRVYRTNVPATCGKCHQGVEAKYEAGIHGSALRKGNPLAPVCADCHSAHDIRRVDVESWRLQMINECGTCHAESIRTYRDTFHGQVTALGFVRVATCADCHGAHDIFPRDDPRSSVSPAHEVTTCAKCHPRANASFVQYDPHADRDNRRRNPILYYAGRFMDGLLIFVFGFFGVHTTLWFSRALAMKRRGGRVAPRAGSGPDRGEEGDRGE